jgi:hypothetical protein
VYVDLDTLATALYVRIDDELKASPQLNRWRPAVGINPKITDAELITVSVMQVLLGYHNESRWIRYARKSIIHLFPSLPKQPGYNKRLRTLSTQLAHFIAVLVTDTDLWQHPIRPVAASRHHRNGGILIWPLRALVGEAACRADGRSPDLVHGIHIFSLA